MKIFNWLKDRKKTDEYIENIYRDVERESEKTTRALKDMNRKLTHDTTYRIGRAVGAVRSK